ncbi:MAG: DUF4976 domain-containing protein, partial [Planctomycetaceae bacterium]|nr:DUF4976 domain-containing protein [Planctomycetaceae bacterium]
HGWFDKRWMYEESMKMPLIVKWPGVTKPGAVNEDLVQNLDYAETFLEMAGTEVPSDMQGASLVPLLQGNTPANWRDSLYYHYFEFPAVHMVARHNGVRTRQHKLIHFYQFGEWELYDLQKDPEELTNVYGQPEYAQVTADLKAQLIALQKQYNEDFDMSVMNAEWQAQYRKPELAE